MAQHHLVVHLRQPLAHDRRCIVERVEHGGPEDALTQPRRAAVDRDDPPDVKRFLAIIDEFELRCRHLNLTGPAGDASVQDDRAAAREMAGKVGLIIPDGVQHARAVGDRGPGDDQPPAPRGRNWRTAPIVPWTVSTAPC